MQENALTRTMQRKDFVDALAFLIAVGKLSEIANHHPDVDLRYNKVYLRLTTHSAGHTVTEKDFLLAAEINGLAENDTQSISQELRQRFAN